MFNFYIREQGCEDPWLFFETKMAREQKLWETLVQRIG
jgi:hypothetical protein